MTTYHEAEFLGAEPMTTEICEWAVDEDGVWHTMTCGQIFNLN